MSQARAPSNIWQEEKDAATAKARLYLQKDANNVWGFTTKATDAEGSFAVDTASGVIGIETPRNSAARIYKVGNAAVPAIVPDEV